MSFGPLCSPTTQPREGEDPARVPWLSVNLWPCSQALAPYRLSHPGFGGVPAKLGAPSSGVAQGTPHSGPTDPEGSRELVRYHRQARQTWVGRCSRRPWQHACTTRPAGPRPAGVAEVGPGGRDGVPSTRGGSPARPAEHQPPTRHGPGSGPRDTPCPRERTWRAGEVSPRSVRPEGEHLGP